MEELWQCQRTVGIMKKTELWLEKCWGRLHISFPCLLIWDSFKSHVTTYIREKVKEHYNSHMVGGCTGILQPADVSWNKPFKEAYRDRYEEWAIDGERSFTAGGRRRPPQKNQIMIWVKEAWQAVTTEVIQKSFRKCGITNMMDGSEDNQALASSDDEIEDPFRESRLPTLPLLNTLIFQ